jgi:hypothetical protein
LWTQRRCTARSCAVTKAGFDAPVRTRNSIHGGFVEFSAVWRQLADHRP